MLKKTKISGAKMVDRHDWSYSKEWKTARLGKITASKMSLICAPEGIGKGGKSFIMDMVGEEMAGEAAYEEIDTEATRHGHLYEYEAAQKFCKIMGWGQIPGDPPFVIDQPLITEQNSRFGATPDLITVFRETANGLEYEVCTTEIKNPLTYKSYIELALCETPQDVKRVSPIYYWQVLAQMDEADCLRGYLVIYHPKMRVGNMNIIEFNRMQSYKNEVRASTTFGHTFYPIKDDLTLLAERKKEAEHLFNEIRDKLLTKGVF